MRAVTAAAPLLVALCVGVAGWLVARGQPGGRLQRMSASPGLRSSTPGGGGSSFGAAVGHRWERVRSVLPRRAVPTTDLAALVGELAGLVRAGVPPVAAWSHAASGAGGDATGAAVLAAADAAAQGRPVADELRRRAAHLPGDAGDGLRSLASSWQVVELTGAPVADVLQRVADGLRDAADLRDARTAAMAAPRATARVLSVLPLIGLGLGELMGASPLQVLTGTTAGRVSGLVGLVLAATGAVWTRSLLRAAAGAR